MIVRKLILSALLLLLSGCGNGFDNEENIKLATDGIRKMYVEKQVMVVDVQLIKESSKKLTGFAKLQSDGQELTVNCTATIGEDSKMIFACQ